MLVSMMIGNRPRMTLIRRIYTDLICDNQSIQCHPWSIPALTGDRDATAYSKISIGRVMQYRDSLGEPCPDVLSFVR